MQGVKARVVSLDVFECDTGWFETGTSGRTVTLQANYFKLETHTDWCLYQYRVDFAPSEDSNFMCKALLRNHKATLGGYIFDGSMLYTSVRLPQDVSKVHNYISYTVLS
jgi:aubergine-like protein